MTTESTPTSPRSRRALLAGAIGGLGVWAASAIGRAAPAEAAAGDPIRMGRLNKASSTATTLQTKTSAAAYLVNQIGAGAAVKGISTTGRAIMGEAGSGGTGVWGSSPNHFAVHATSDHGTGVYAQSTDTGDGIYAAANQGNAIIGESNSGWAGWFVGRVRLGGYQDIQGLNGDPAAPAAGVARLFARDDGAKTRLCVRFATGVVQVIATEP